MNECDWQVLLRFRFVKWEWNDWKVLIEFTWYEWKEKWGQLSRSTNQNFELLTVNWSNKKDYFGHHHHHHRHDRRETKWKKPFRIRNYRTYLLIFLWQFRDGQTHLLFWFWGWSWPGQRGLRWNKRFHRCLKACSLIQVAETRQALNRCVFDIQESKAWNTLQANLWGHKWPKPKGGEIFLNKVTTSKCFMRPLKGNTEISEEIQQVFFDKRKLIG